MNPRLIDRLLFGRLLFVTLGLFFVLFCFLSLLYFFVFVVLDNLEPVFGKFIILKCEEPFNVDFFFFFIQHWELDLEVIGAGGVGNHWNIDVTTFIFRLGYLSLERELLWFINVVEHTSVEVEKEESVIFEDWYGSLGLLGVGVVNSLAIDGFGLHVLLHLSFGQFHVGSYDIGDDHLSVLLIFQFVIFADMI